MIRASLMLVLIPLAAVAADDPFEKMVTYDLHGATYDTSIDADFIEVIKHSEGDKMTNQQPSAAISSDGVWVVSWTQATREAAKDESVVSATSFDGGKTWSDPVDIERASEGRTGSWAMTFCVPHTGRFYTFYWWNENNNPKRDAGHIYVRYSDDDGMSWSGRHQIPIPRHAFDKEGQDQHGWNTGFPILTPDGAMLLGYTKMAGEWETSQGGAGVQDGAQNWWCEVFFLRIDNILTETDVTKLNYKVYPEGDHGLWVYDDLNPELHFMQEPYMAVLPSGRIIATMRVMLGHPYYSISDDYGKTWTKPQALRSRPGGEKLKHVCGPCQISSSPDGRIYFLLSNRNDPLGPEDYWGRRWANRDPVHVVVGREMPLLAEGLPQEEANAGLYFDKPRVLLKGVPADPSEHPNVSSHAQKRTAAYPQLLHWGQRHFVMYANTKADIRLKEVPDELLSGYGIPQVDVSRK